MTEERAATGSGAVTARRPSDLGWRDWWAILRRSWATIGRENLSLVAAGVAFYALFALFPTLSVLVALYGFVADPVDVRDQLNALSELAPEEALGPVKEQLETLAGASRSTLSLTTVFGLALALWSSRAGVSAMILGLNIAYKEREKRNYFLHLAVSLALTLALVVVVAVAIAMVVAIPLVLASLPFEPGFAATAVNVLRWPLAMVTVMVGIALLYRYGPARRGPRLPWFTWGAALATFFWLLASLLFSYYVAAFANYNETYGSLAAIIALLMWFFVSALVVLAGAALNAEMEYQTRLDTTVGPPRPLGERGAFVADHLPPRRESEPPPD